MRRMQGREEALKLVAVFEVSILLVDICQVKCLTYLAEACEYVFGASSFRCRILSGCLQDDEQAYVITEVCYGGTLEHFMRVNTAYPL